MDGTDGGRHGRVLWGLLSLLCAGGIAGSLFLGGRAVARDETAAAALARTRTVLSLAPLLEPADLAGPVRGARYRELLEAVRRDVIADGPFTSVTIWNPSATAVFSTEEAEVGRRAPQLRAVIDRAMRGGTERRVVGEDLETWVPVRLKLDGPVVAVARFRQPYDELWARANRPWRIAAIGLGALLLVSGAMLGFTFRPAPGTRRPARRPVGVASPVPAPAPSAGGTGDGAEEPALAAVGGGRAPGRRAERGSAGPPVYAVPGFREQVQAREAAEARAAAAEEQAARLRSDFERALAEMRAMQERLRELEGAAQAAGTSSATRAAGGRAAAGGPRPDLEAALRMMEQRAEAAERRAERAEAKVAELQGAAQRTRVLEAELAEARAGAERAALLEAELAEARAGAERAALLEAELADLRAAAGRAEELEREVEELRRRVEAAAQLERENAELRGAAERVAALEAELAEAADRIRIAEGAAGAARGENQALWERLVQADQRLEESQAERQALEAKVRELEAALAEAPGTGPDPTVEIRLQEAERRAIAAEEALREAQARIAAGLADPEAEARTRQAEERARLAEERFAEAARALREAEERAARAERELEELRARAPAGAGGEASELEQALAATQERLRRAGERLQATEERARATERELEQVRAQLEETQAQLRRTKMEEALKALRGDGEPRRAEVRSEGARPAAEAPLEDRRAAGPFVKALSLEAKNALSAILGVTLALKHTHDPGDQQGLLRKLQAHAKKLDHVVHDLVDADRLARGAVELHRRRTDLDALVRRVVEELDVEAERNVEIESERLVLPVDPVRVEQIVTALLTGALNRTGPGSHIWVRVRAEEGGALIAVEDEELSSDAALSPVVLRLADLHGGWARVEGRPTGGSSFQVFLPERDPAAERGPEAHPAPEPEAAAD